MRTEAMYDIPEIFAGRFDDLVKNGLDKASSATVGLSRICPTGAIAATKRSPDADRVSVPACSADAFDAYAESHT